MSFQYVTQTSYQTIANDMLLNNKPEWPKRQQAASAHKSNRLCHPILHFIVLQYRRIFSRRLLPSPPRGWYWSCAYPQFHYSGRLQILQKWKLIVNRKNHHKTTFIDILTIIKERCSFSKVLLNSEVVKNVKKWQ